MVRYEKWLALHCKTCSVSYLLMCEALGYDALARKSLNPQVLNSLATATQRTVTFPWLLAHHPVGQIKPSQMAKSVLPSAA